MRALRGVRSNLRPVEQSAGDSAGSKIAILTAALFALLLVAPLEDAARFLASGDLAAAERVLDGILQRQPDEPEAQSLLAVVRAEQKRDTEAERLFESAVRSAPGLVSARVNAAKFYSSRNRLDPATDHLDKAHALRPDDPEISAAYVSLLRTRAAENVKRDPERALADLLCAVRLSEEPELQFETGMVELTLGLYADAVRTLRPLTERKPGEPRYLYALGRALLGTPEYPDAEERFAQYVRIRPEDASGFYALGYIKALLRKNGEAEAAFRRSLELQPAQTESNYQLGVMAYAAKNLDLAGGYFTAVLERAPSHAGATLGMGQVLFTLKRYPEARTALERACRLDPGSSTSHYYLGRVLLAIGEEAAGNAELETAANLQKQEKDRRRLVVTLAEPDAQQR